MNRPLEGDCSLKLFTFENDEGRDTFWHSSAHILGQALEKKYGCKLCIGPCTTRGEVTFRLYALSLPFSLNLLCLVLIRPYALNICYSILSLFAVHVHRFRFLKCFCQIVASSLVPYDDSYFIISGVFGFVKPSLEVSRVTSILR